MAVAEKTPTTDRRIDLSEEDLEKKIGDYAYRLRKASVARYYEEPQSWGGIDVIPSEEEYLILDIDGEWREPIPREEQAIEQLVALFDSALEKALSDL